jgi:hypothetical protein
LLTKELYLSTENNDYFLASTAVYGKLTEVHLTPNVNPSSSKSNTHYFVSILISACCNYQGNQSCKLFCNIAILKGQREKKSKLVPHFKSSQSVFHLIFAD